MNTADIIKKRREELGLSQEELAEKLGYKSRSSINKIELELSDIPFAKIPSFAKVLDIKPELLMGWREEKPKQEETSNVAHIYDESDFIKMIAVPGLKPNETTYFPMKVRGNNTKSKIPNGSTIIIKKDIAIENREIGVFSLNYENFVKQKKIIKNKLVLHSFNLAYDNKVIKVMVDL